MMKIKTILNLAIVLISSILPLAIAGEISGKIESCSGWSLNKLPEVKAFVKGGGAEMYYNVEIEFIPGKKATLTIFDDNKMTEKIILSDIETELEMHTLMKEKGFQKKSKEAIYKLTEQREAADIEAENIRIRKQNEADVKKKARRNELHSRGHRENEL